MRAGRKTALLGAMAVGAYAAIRGRLRRYEIAERSMEPGLSPGDYIVAQALRAGPNRGDIVIFRHPGVPHMELVKRVVGLPGEHVVISRGQVHVNDAVLAEPWADGPTLPDEEWDLELDQVFVLGDNRALSGADSRTVGPISVGDVRWRVVARYWPLPSAGRIGF